MVRRTSAQRLATKRAVARELLHHGSPYVLVLASGAAVVARSLDGGELRAQDAVALVIVVVAQPFVEWGLHRFVLHAPGRTLAGRPFDPGASHRGHHRTPDDVGGALLGTPYAISDSLAIAAAAGLVGLAVTPLLGAYPVAAVTTGVAGGCLGLLWYEWAHVLFHSGYRPRTAWFRRLRTNHRRHHYRDDRAWFGITSTFVDRLVSW
jgi:sterol desaturase/sphingolipid hydroxylase (fatty acid hydroxylase superfamily)